MRSRSARRARSASRCAPSARRPPLDRRTDSRQRSRCWRPRPRGWSTLACWSTSAPRSAPPDSAPRPGSRCSRRSTLAARCGARALERRARAELAAIGVRPGPADRTGSDSLTPSERRVVELAAAAAPTARSPRRCSYREDSRDPSRASVSKARRLLPAAASRRAAQPRADALSDSLSKAAPRFGRPPRLPVQDCKSIPESWPPASPGDGDWAARVASTPGVSAQCSGVDVGDAPDVRSFSGRTIAARAT